VALLFNPLTTKPFLKRRVFASVLTLKNTIAGDWLNLQGGPEKNYWRQ